ncbi:MAG: phage holin family protein [Muribaculaceae bacterium]|nr:phage holin family protein [Muribaculaceae bacterium]MBR3100601.1 phage holin family protein [Muribaculaceae bacterium]
MILRLIVSALAVWITAWVLDGVTVEPWWAALLVAVVLGVINALIRPVVKLLSLPINLVTLGLFTLVINALMVMLGSWCLGEYFKVENFWWALAFSVALCIVNWLLHLFTKKGK